MNALEVASASKVVGDAITQLSGDVGTVIPAALGVSVLVFGAVFLWRVVRRLVK